MKTVKKYFVYVMGAVYILAGVNHFVHEPFYTKMLAGFLPYPLALVYISGVVEILCGLGLLIPSTRKAAAWGTVLLLLAIFPANINMAVHHEHWPDISTSALYLRLPVQLILIWLAYVYTKD
jgi:uncharacterized membrane protein